MNQKSLDLEATLFNKTGTSLGFPGEQSSIFHTSAHTLRHNLREETRYALEYSNKYSYLSLGISLAKLIASIYVLFLTGPICIQSWQFWIIAMVLYDLFNVSIIVKRLKNIRDLNAEEAANMKANAVKRQLSEVNYNPQSYILDQVNVQAAPEQSIRRGDQSVFPEEKISNEAVILLKERRTIDTLAKASQILYLCLLIIGQVLYLKSVPTVCDSQQSKNLVLMYLIIAYLWFLGPIILFLLSCLLAPLLLIFAWLFGKSNQTPGYVKVDVSKLPLKFFSYDMEGDLECSICMLEFHEGDKIVPLPCNPKHYFHEPCLKRWLKINSACPTCKVSIESKRERDTPNGDDNKTSNRTTIEPQ
jgi:hypothetical protein